MFRRNVLFYYFIIMATSNFHSESWIYFVVTDRSYNRLGSKGIYRRIREALSKSFKNKFSDCDFIDSTELRSYPSHSIWVVNIEKKYGDYVFEYNFYIVLRSWYYSDGNIDYYKCLLVDWVEQEETIGWWWWSSNDVSKQKYDLYCRYFKSYCNTELPKIEKRLISCLSRCCNTRLRKIWSFSNWEAVYEKI